MQHDEQQYTLLCQIRTQSCADRSEVGLQIRTGFKKIPFLNTIKYILMFKQGHHYEKDLRFAFTKSLSAALSG